MIAIVDLGLAAADREVWRAMEGLHDAGKTRFLGISNVTLPQLEELFAFAAVPPAFVQNRCFARLAWDREVRAFCRTNGAVYQGFSLLTANVQELRAPAFARLSARVRKGPAQIVFRFAQQVGMLPLTGTTHPDHMREDLEADRFDLSEDDLRLVETIAAR